MKRPDIAKWKNIENLEGLLFFAQVLEDMLFHHTIDTFKAPALNTQSRVFELMSLGAQLFNDRIKVGAISPVIEELKYSIKNDPVIGVGTRELLLHYMSIIDKEKSNYSKLMPTIEGLLFEIQKSYWQDLRKSIFEAISNTKRKKDIYSLASAFVVQVELRGFSRECLYFESNNYFFNSKAHPRNIDNIAQVNEFMSIFENKNKKWTAVIRCSKEFKNYEKHTEIFDIKIQDEIPKFEGLSFTKKSFLGRSEKNPLYIVVSNIDATNPYNARDKALNNLEFFIDICRFHDHKMEFNWTDTCLVVDEEKKSALIKPRRNPMSCNIERSVEEGATGVEQTLNVLTEGYISSFSFAGIKNAMEYHRAALETKTNENQLIDLWAAFEGIMPTPSAEGARISSYIDAILPSLTLTYANKIFRYMAENLYNYGDKIREHINKIEIEGNFFDKSNCIILCADMEDSRKELYALIDDDPLFRYRIYDCHNRFKDSESTRSTLNSHKQWVTWHIQRIYTTRNQIIHSASSLPYIRTLIENMHTYYDTLIMAIFQVCLKDKIQLDIDAAVKILQTHEIIYFENLNQKNDICKKDNYKGIVFGKQNILSPYYQSNLTTG